MITRSQCDDCKQKIVEIKNRLIQLGLFCELEPLFDNIASVHSSSTRRYISQNNDNEEEDNFDADCRSKILNSLKNNIESLLVEIERDIKNHLE